MSPALASGPSDQAVNSRLSNEATSRARRESVRNIGVIPVITDIARRQAALKSLITFGTTYWGDQMWELSASHKRFIRRLELLIRKGGRSIIVLPRGFGKSVWSRIAVLYAVANGLRQFCPLLAANGTHAENNYAGAKSLIESELFAEDFPEIAYPILKLEGITHRCSGQTYTDHKGETQSTNLEYNAKIILLPATDGSVDTLGNFHKNKARNSVIMSQGLMAAIRGLSVVIWDGTALRPDFCICDDPQDEDSAISPTQTAKRMRVIKNSLIGSGGHSKGLALAMPATIIAEGDMIEQLLDDPAWPGDRVAFFEKLPDNMETMWLTRYRKIREDYDKNDPDDRYRAISDSNAFYIENREEMDSGARVAWEECYVRDELGEDGEISMEGEVSAIQHGMNALIDIGDDYFYCELQNKPKREVTGDNITYENLVDATTKIERGIVPGWATKITGAIDVHDNILYHMTVAWDEETFTGHVIDYGEFPPQQVTTFKQNAIRKDLASVFPGLSKEAAIRAGLDQLMEKMEAIQFKCQDGSTRHIDRVLIDSGYQQEVIFRAILESDSRLFLPSKGVPGKAIKEEFDSVTRNRKNRSKSDIVTFGSNWRACKIAKYQALQRVFYDADAWKTFLQSRIMAPNGADGALRFYSYRPKHDLMYDHMMSEKGTWVEAKGRKVLEFENPFRRDNHWWDTLVYCCIGANMLGCSIKGTAPVQSERTGRKPRRIGY